MAFYVRKLGLIVEIDGSSHEYKINYDRKRINYFKKLGLKTFMVDDVEVKLRMDLVLGDLERFIISELG